MRIASLVLALLFGCGGAPPPSSTTPTPTGASPSANQGSYARLESRWPDGSVRTCAIVWTSPGTSWLYDGTLTLVRDGMHATGTIDWRLVTTGETMPELAARQGEHAGERIEGAFDTTTGEFVMQTTWLGDPTLNGAARYRLELTEDGLRGATAGIEDGIWDGDIRCTTLLASP